MDMLWWAVIVIAIFSIGLTKAGFGAGLGLLAVPLMTIAAANLPTLGSKAALPLMLPLLIAGDVIAVWQYRRQFDFGRVRRLLPGTVIGVGLGSLLLWWLQQHGEQIAAALIRLEIGLESVLLVGLHWWRTSRGEVPLYVPKAWHDHSIGTFCGVSSTLAHAAGPIIALYLLPQRLDRQVFVGTCAIYFMILNAIKFPAYFASGLFEVVSPIYALQFLPLVLLGALAGYTLVRRMSDQAFAAMVYQVTFAVGLYLVIDGTLRLWWAVAG